MLLPSYLSLRRQAPLTGLPIMGGSNGEAVASDPRLNLPPPGWRRYRHPSDRAPVASRCATKVECAGDNFMAKRIKRSAMWSMKADRELIALSKTKTIKTLADHFQRQPKSILTKAKRLGLSIKRTAKGK
jgi:hypothetical protein